MHALCTRLDPTLRTVRVHPEAYRGMWNRYRAIITAFQDLELPAPTGRGLEVGVGEGTLLLLLQEFVPQIQWHGLDIPRRHALYQADFDALLRERKVELTEADLTRQGIPFPDSGFLAISFSEVAEHLPPNALLPTLHEIRRVLVPGGLLVATSPNLTSLLNRFLIAVGRSPFHLPVPEDVGGCATYPYIHLFTAGEFEALCRLAGLEPLRREHITYLANAFFSAGRPLRNAAMRVYLLLEHLLGTLLPDLRDGWLVAARRPPP
ncbi:MAG: class I SAM-dependent methyltransferase [Kiritimatiellae bacterium]|nr:class I SAM-dependent methyltransferase [Kiritimatiellia bacterium]